MIAERPRSVHEVGFQVEEMNAHHQVTEAQFVTITQHARLVRQHSHPVQIRAVCAAEILDLQQVAIFGDGHMLP